VYIKCSARGNCVARTNAERGCARPREDSERDRWTLSELRDQCWNVSATSLLALDLHPNIAGIGTLQRLPQFCLAKSVKHLHAAPHILTCMADPQAAVAI
jgi:hypothetical protein